MKNLQTTYLGLKLSNPLILGACNLSLNVDTARQLQNEGIAAIVCKSLLEEQLLLEQVQLKEDMEQYNERHAEMIRIFPGLRHAGPQEHLHHLSRLKSVLSIPVIGSLNCIHEETWVEYALEMEKTGIDALELNFFAVPGNISEPGSSIEEQQLETIRKVKSTLKIPVSIKLSAFYSNLHHFIKQADNAGANGLVLFNRLFEPDINVEKQAMSFPFHLSLPGDYRLSLRYAGILHGELQGSICCNTGILTGYDVVRVLLAGADAAQVVSTLYRNKLSQIGKMLDEISRWMEDKGFASVSEFKGLLSKTTSNDPYAYVRTQYVDLLLNPDKILKRYPQI